MKTVDVVCPVYAEEAGIALFHHELANALAACPRFNFRITYVVDPASDGTESQLAALASADPRVRVIVLSRRFGHQAALVAGLDHADGDAAVMLDADLQHPPALIQTMLEHWEAGADIVQGLRQDERSPHRLRTAVGVLFYRVISRLSRLQLDPGSADFRLLDARVVAIFRDQLREQNPFVRGLTQWVGFRVALVPFDVGSRVAGSSKYAVSRLLEFALTGITSFSKAPIRTAAVVGFLMSALSFLYGAFAVIAFFAGSYVPPGWTSTLATVALVGGIQLFFLGLLAEYIGYIFDEVKARPRYLVARSFGRDAVGGVAESLPIVQVRANGIVP